MRFHLQVHVLSFIIILCSCFYVGVAFTSVSLNGNAVAAPIIDSRCRQVQRSDNDGNSDDVEDSGDDIIDESATGSSSDSCRSSDMTDRFKYKVNALMGTYDPQNGIDDERQDGNILQGEREV